MSAVIFGLTGKIKIGKRFSSHWPAMSLIPSESYSFPDHFTSTRAASCKAKNIEPEPVEPPPRKPAIVALPNPEPEPQPAPVMVRQNPEPVRKIAPPVPNPALRRAAAPPPRIPEAPVRKLALPPSLKPKVRWNNRAPAMDPTPKPTNGNGAAHIHQESLMPAENVIQMRPPPAARPPRMMPRPENAPVPAPPPRKPIPEPPPAKPIAAPPIPKPVPVAKSVQPVPVAKPVQRVPPAKPTQPVQRVQAPMPVRQNARPVAAAPNPQADFFEAFAQSGETAVSKRRRKAKMRRFLFCESIAVGVLLPLAILGLAFHPENTALRWIMNISTIAAAVAAALIPILFFALTPTLPE